ncbi:MAG: MFS transporter, partial [Pseudomonadales bacterium]
MREDREATVGDYGFLLFLTVINVLNVLDRQLIASMANWIKPELDLTNTQFGLLTGLIFILFYAVAGVFMGVLADRVNRTRLIAFGLAVWSALTAISGMAKGFVSLAIPRLFIGIGESIMTPTSMSLLSDRFPAKNLGFAAGTYYMAGPIGISLSLLVVAYLEPLVGWRGCFYVLGGLGVGLSIVMYFMRETPRRSAVTKVADKIEIPSISEML